MLSDTADAKSQDDRMEIELRPVFADPDLDRSTLTLFPDIVERSVGRGEIPAIAKGLSGSIGAFARVGRTWRGLGASHALFCAQYSETGHMHARIFAPLSRRILA